MLVFNMIWKPSLKSLPTPESFHRFTPLQIVAAAFNGCLGLVNLCLGSWVLEEKLRNTHTAFPLHWWLRTVSRFHLVAFEFNHKPRGNYLPRAPMRLLSVLTFLLAGIVCVPPITAAILSKKVTVKAVVDVISFPGAILLLLFFASKELIKPMFQFIRLFVLLQVSSDLSIIDLEVLFFLTPLLLGLL